MKELGISVIVTTYNWPQALAKVLSGLAKQDYQHFEIIIADDGSTTDTAQLIQHWQSQCSVPIQHCWQPDEGFRAARIRNQAAAQAKYEYLIFMDGDCVPLPNFMRQQAKLAEPSWFVAGNRLLLNERFTQQVLQQNLPIEQWSLKKWLGAALARHCNGFASLVKLPLGPLRKLAPQRWQGVKTCNLAVWRQDFIAVNGLDENYQGWGFEDSDLVVRLQHHGIYRKSGKFAVPVIHLWHPLQDKAKMKENESRFKQALKSVQIKASQGIEQHLNYGHD